LMLSSLDLKGAVINEVIVDKTDLIFRGETGSLGDIHELQQTMKSVFNEPVVDDSKESAGGKMIFTITAKQRK
jgi:hypothetical protein